MKHVLVFAEKGLFAGWPANNGAWAWNGLEVLVGFTVGPYATQPGHNIGHPYSSHLARSEDGGETWRLETPEPFVGRSGAPSDLTGRIDFGRPGFAMRVVGIGYHGSEERRGAFFTSYDRGRTWRGPHRFQGLSDLRFLEGAEITPRTDYLVNGPDDCLLFLSARSAERWGSDRAFCIRTTDGGATFRFVSWIVPPEDPYRAVMPATVRCSATRLVSALRRRDIAGGDCWIDAYASGNNGQSWSFLSRIGETGGHNGNPPALVRTADGRVCCVYGQRNDRRIVVRISRDEGASWEALKVLRDDYASVEDDQDLGYPRLVQRADGRLLALYYWATAERPHQHIAATIWDPDV